MSDCRFVNASKDFFLSAMVNDDDRDAGLPKRKGNAIIQLFTVHRNTNIDITTVTRFYCKYLKVMMWS